MPRKQPEHEEVRLPLFSEFEKLGWDKHQLQFSPEWCVPKAPSEACKREAGNKFDGYPVDIAIFDSPSTLGDDEHIVILVETKSPNKKTGVNQLKIYMGLEPHVRLGIWTNGKEKAFVY